MKYIFFCLLLSAVGWSSCYKAVDQAKDPNPPTYRFYLNGGSQTDSSMWFYAFDGGTLDLNFDFRRVTGNPENYPISVIIDSLPPGMTAATRQTDFMLNYRFSTTIKVGQLPVGNYTITVRVKEPNRTKKYFNYVKILSVPDPALCLKGTYISENNLRYGDSCTVTIDTITGMPNWVHIKNVACLGDSIAVNAQITSDGLVIPMQTTHGYTIYGTKSNYTCGFNFMSFPVTIIHDGVSQACMLHWQR